VAEHARTAAVRQQQRREEPDQGRLAGAVLAQDRDALAARHFKGDALQRSDAGALAPVLADELLAQVGYFTAAITCS
jgi:hypothetical protein